MGLSMIPRVVEGITLVYKSVQSLPRFTQTEQHVTVNLLRSLGSNPGCL
jgi:hypothetical protein